MQNISLVTPASVTTLLDSREGMHKKKRSEVKINFEGDKQSQHVETSADSVQEQLSRIIGSSTFSSAKRQSRFLCYIVEKTLAGTAQKLSQYQIGLEVFDRDESFDPSTNALVRIEAGRLRAKLAEYYSEYGHTDPVRISLPRGGYMAVIDILEEKVTDERTTNAHTFTQLGEWNSSLMFAFGFVIASMIAVLIN